MAWFTAQSGTASPLFALLLDSTTACARNTMHVPKSIHELSSKYDGLKMLLMTNFQLSDDDVYLHIGMFDNPVSRVLESQG